MDLGLAGKTAIVTGGGSNIGRAIVLALASEGMNVVIAELMEESGKKVADLANSKKAGGKAIVVKTDVTNWDSVQAMVKKAVAEFGQVHVLVNNVGWTFDRFFLEKPVEEYQKEINLNLLSNIYCTRAILPHFIEKKGGKVVSLASDAGRMGEFREAVYGACKAGVICLAKSLTREYSRNNITFNCIAPGATIPMTADEVSDISIFSKQGFGAGITQEAIPKEQREKMAKAYPLGRLGTNVDIAKAVVFFSSNLSDYITGQTISVSGGYAMVS
ncbi:MAG: SDR family oxidoreductase [Chloroflexi bacterium]|nr:SDR family oxidoreductase [Chloroflexota bacterium]